MRTRPRPTLLHLIVTLAMLVAGALASVAPATATPEEGPRGATGPQTDLVFESLGQGQGVAGFFPPSDSPFDPAVAPYPSSNPAGWTFQAEDFAGTLIGAPPGGGPSVSLYCIDLFTATSPGYGYVQGSWDASNVPRVGLVARALSLYYPATDAPAAPSAEAKAAAVQATIWYFSDRYVLATADPLHSLVASMVQEVQELGPVPEPTPPDLAVTPASSRGPVGEEIGPFTITTDDPAGATVELFDAPVGAELATADGPLAPGALVPDGTQVFITGVTTPAAGMTVSARASTEVASGSVYLYDGETPGVTSAQKLILAETATTQTTASATAEAFATGSIGVTKQIVGGDGETGDIVIEVVCAGDALDAFVLPAGTRDGTQARVYDGIEAGATCTVTETADGANARVTVEVTAATQTLDVVADEQVEATPIVNSYSQVSPSTTTTTSTTSTSTSTTTTPTGGSGGDGTGSGDVGNAGTGRGSGWLPYTGDNTLALALVALVVVGGGAVLALAARRGRLS